MIRTILAALTALAVALTTLPAQGSQADFASRPADLLARFDSDLDGSVDRAEYLAYLSKGFKARDADGNGVLEGSELPPNAASLTRVTHEARLMRQFQRQDRSGDERLDEAELLAPPGR